MQRHIVSVKPKKAANVIFSEGLAQLYAAGIDIFRQLHPEQVNRAFPMPCLPPAAERCRLATPGAMSAIIADLPSQPVHGLTGWTSRTRAY